MKPDFKDRRVEKGMEEGLSGLLKIGKRRTKVRKSWMSRVSSEEWKKPRFVISGGLPKNRKLKDSSRMGFRRTEKGEPLLRFVSILSYES
ncbi:unnamed protein product [Rhizophagus irregularis]|nr:unnamed protein product [Rhizophagus irregularis]CAB4396812.1 unnamed protein product [Rhizophagus irregularis]